MNILYLVGGLGFSMGLIAVGIALLLQRAEAKRVVPKAQMPLGWLSAGPTGLIAQIGQNGDAHRSLDTVILRPTWAARLVNGAILILLWMTVLGPGSEAYRSDIFLVALILGVTVAVTLFLAFYEVRYDADGVTAPKWIVLSRSYRWEDLISVSDGGAHITKLRFETGTANINKYLVGMPTFIAFVSEVSELNRRL